MKRFKKIFNIVLMIIIITIPVISLASDVGLGTDLNKYATPKGDSTAFNNMAGAILVIVQTVGSVMSLTVLVVLGIKYMMASVEERADYKKSMMPYLIGSVLTFGIVNLLTVVAEIAGNMF